MVDAKPKKRRIWLRSLTVFIFLRRGVALTDAEMLVLFIHGAPGSSDAFYSYLVDSTLAEKAHLVTYDRPGYGYSDYGEPLTSIKTQAEAVLHVLNHLSFKKVILVSHSYGCAIAGVFAADHPSLVSANIMVCPVVDPDEEKYFFFSSWPSLPIIKKLFSGAVQVSSFEKMTHTAELKKIEPLWQKTEVPTIIMHGEKDWIAPIENAYFLNDKIPSHYLKIEIDKTASHFIVWTQHNHIVQTIRQYF